MNLFLRYLAQYRFTALLLLIFSGIFAAVLSLYKLQAEAVLYALAICAAVLLMAISVHFQRFKRKYLDRQRLSHNITLITEPFFEPDSPLEELYAGMLEKLRAFGNDIENKYTQERSDSIDYYTTWAHQIKTPISTMQMILQTEDSEDYRALSAELFRIEQYVEMALCRFRLDSPSGDFVIETVSLDKTIRAGVRKYALQFIQKKIKLVYNGTEETAVSDEKWLLFILEQLLSNAVKYTNSGSVFISVSDNIIKITDTGIGIAAEDLPRIFEKGYTGYNGRADKKSTGLGLYLCKKAADKLSLGLYAESEIGKGSTFCIDLNSEKIYPE